VDFEPCKTFDFKSTNRKMSLWFSTPMIGSTPAIRIETFADTVAATPSWRLFSVKTATPLWFSILKIKFLYGSLVASIKGF
jgi:hypothetical protein